MKKVKINEARHRNPNMKPPTVWNGGSRGGIKTKPYFSDYVKSYNNNGFKNAKAKNTYVKVIKYVADHDGCTRSDILKSLGNATGRGGLHPGILLL